VAALQPVVDGTGKLAPGGSRSDIDPGSRAFDLKK
jgi:hypothetical protein